TMHYRLLASTLAAILLCTAASGADRVRGPVDPGRFHVLPGNTHRLATAQYDQGAVDPAMRMEDIMLLTRPSASQQADLDQLLAEQRNPSSPEYHKWLTPEQFGNRFGLSTSDHSKVVAWLASQGLDI